MNVPYFCDMNVFIVKYDLKLYMNVTGHQKNMSATWIPPRTPLLYSKTGIGI